MAAVAADCGSCSSSAYLPEFRLVEPHADNLGFGTGPLHQNQLRRPGHFPVTSGSATRSGLAADSMRVSRMLASQALGGA
jgi:hypothetical protein